MQLPDTGYFNITNAELELDDGYMAVRGDIDLDQDSVSTAWSAAEERVAQSFKKPREDI